MIMNKTMQEQLASMNFTINTNQEDTQMAETINTPVQPTIEFKEQSTAKPKATNKSTGKSTTGGKTMKSQPKATTKFQKVTMESIPILEVDPQVARHYITTQMYGGIGEAARSLAVASRNEDTDRACQLVYSFWYWGNREAKKVLYNQMMNFINAMAAANEPFGTKAARIFDGIVEFVGAANAAIISGTTKAIGTGWAAGIVSAAQSKVDIRKAKLMSQLIVGSDPELIVLEARVRKMNELIASTGADAADKPVAKPESKDDTNVSK